MVQGSLKAMIRLVLDQGWDLKSSLICLYIHWLNGGPRSPRSAGGRRPSGGARAPLEGRTFSVGFFPTLKDARQGV